MGEARRSAARGAGVLLAAALAGAAAGCGGEPPSGAPAEEAYARPGYARASDDGASTPLHFTDVAAEAGIDFTHRTGAFGEKWMPETMGSGAAFLHWDDDGFPDILLVDSGWWPGHELGGTPPFPRLYRNRGDGTFADVTERAGLDDVTGEGFYGMGVAAADFDADGDTDVYLTAVGTNLLLRNDGGRLVDVTAAAGATGDAPAAGSPPAWSTGAAWVDTDRDGWLDLFVCNYVRWTPETDLFTTLDGETKSYATPESYEGESCRLYRNRAGEGFVDVTEAAGVRNPEGKSLGVAIDDFDDDGWIDLFVANDMYRNFLYMNQGDGSYTDRAVSAGVAVDEFGRARAGMGVDVADVTGRNRLSIAIGNFTGEPVSLYTRIGNDLFQDLAGSARLGRGTLTPLTFGLVFADPDLDGDPDLVVANGHIEPSISRIRSDVAFAQPPQLFLNTGDGRFVEATDQVGEDFARPMVGRGVAVADYDRDGDPDVLITANGGAPRLLRNDLPAREAAWVRLALRGAPPNLDAVGARVTLFAGGRTQRKLVRTGSSYLSQSETNPLLFGVGDAERIDSVHVRWPTTGRIDRFGPLEIRRDHTLREAGSPGAGAEAPGSPWGGAR